MIGRLNLHSPAFGRLTQFFGAVNKNGGKYANLHKQYTGLT